MSAFTGRRRINRQELLDHRTTVPNTQDAIYSPLYDYQTYAAAGQLQLNFFSVQIGQGTTSHPGGAGPKTEADTNLTNAGMLPAGNRFLCIGIEIEFWPGPTPGFNVAVALSAAEVGRQWDDVYVVSRSGWVRFRIQNRDYVLDAPVGKFPSTTRLAGGMALSDSTVAATSLVNQIEYAAFAGAAYNIVPVYITATQAFSVQLNWPNLIALPSAVVARIGVRLIGDLIRDAQ